MTLPLELKVGDGYVEVSMTKQEEVLLHVIDDDDVTAAVILNEQHVRWLINWLQRNIARPEAGGSSDAKDAARYRFLQRTTCGNTAGGKGSDEECYLSLNPRDMDAAIDANLEYNSREPQPQCLQEKK